MISIFLFHLGEQMTEIFANLFVNVIGSRAFSSVSTLRTFSFIRDIVQGESIRKTIFFRFSFWLNITCANDEMFHNFF